MSFSVHPLGRAPRFAIDVSDLLEAPYQFGGVNPATGIDCLGVALAVHRRLGLFRPVYPVDRATAQNWLLGPGWTPLARDAAALRELGDVVVTDGGANAPLGVAVVFALGRPTGAPTGAQGASGDPWLLTAQPKLGVRTLRASALWRNVGGPEGVRGCYRWRPVGPPAHT